jgi:hypothetical protein
MQDNQTMQPSGEVGRFEVVDCPSPPADRHRYPTESASSWCRHAQYDRASLLGVCGSGGNDPASFGRLSTSLQSLIAAPIALSLAHQMAIAFKNA